MDTIPQDTPLKQCTKCPNAYPTTREYFHSDRSRKDGLFPTCKQCCRESDVKRNASAERKEYGRQYRTEHKEERHAKAKEYRETRKEELSERYKKWLHAHREERLVYHKQYGRVHRQEISTREKEYWHSHKEERNARRRNRHARKKAISGTHTAAQIAEQLKRQKYRCYYAACGFAKFERIKENGTWKYDYEVEHTFPISRVAGTDIPANEMSYLVLACPTCNGSKGKKFPWEWIEGGRLL